MNSTPKFPEHDKDPESPRNAGIVEDARPRVMIKDPASGTLVETKDRSKVYSGCEAHVHVGIFTTQLSAAEPQIDVGLNMLQVTGRPFPRFDNRPTAEEAFGDMSDEAPPPLEDAPPMETGFDTSTAEDVDELAELGL